LDPAHATVIVGTVTAIAFLAGALQDGTLIMQRPNVGLLQHPGIWWFLIAQCWLPFVARRSYRQFEMLDTNGVHALLSAYLNGRFAQQRRFIGEWTQRRTNQSRMMYVALLVVGGCAWSWNTYSNQRPDVVGFDFWDSSRHLWGYSLTRLYKGYVWFGLVPALVHTLVGLIIATRRLLLDATASNGLVFEPFDPDGAGGMTFFIDIALTPMVPVVFVASMISLSAVLVHQKYDVTTIAGVSLACLIFILMYLVPATALRKAILAEKRRQISSIANLQQSLYVAVTQAHQSSDLSEPVETMLQLDSVIARIKTLTEWPQLRGILRLVALAWGSPILAWATKTLADRLVSGH
jgi:hypothetical protein